MTYHLWPWSKDIFLAMVKLPGKTQFAFVSNDGLAWSTKSVTMHHIGDSEIAQCQGYAGTPQVLWLVSGDSEIAQCQGYASTPRVLWLVSGDSEIAQCQGYASTPQVLWLVSEDSEIAQCQGYAGTPQVLWLVSGDSGVVQCQGYAGTPQVLWLVSGDSGVVQLLKVLGVQPWEPRFKRSHFMSFVWPRCMSSSHLS